MCGETELRGSIIKPFVLLFVLALASPARGEALPSNERLIELFEQAAFRIPAWPELTSFRELENIRRWRYPIRYEIDPIELTQEFTKSRVLYEIEALTRLKIDFTEPRTQRMTNFWISSLPPDALQEFLELIAHKSRNSDKRLLSRKQVTEVANALRCEQLAGRGDDPFLRAAIVLFRIGIEAPVRRHCIVKTMLQAFGLGGISLTSQHSMTKVDGRDLSAFPLDAKILLRTLYDKRIEPGMGRAAAMAAAREIIPELTAAVARDGVEALYQYYWQWPAR